MRPTPGVRPRTQPQSQWTVNMCPGNGGRVCDGVTHQPAWTTQRSGNSLRGPDPPSQPHSGNRTSSVRRVGPRTTDSGGGEEALCPLAVSLALRAAPNEPGRAPATCTPPPSQIMQRCVRGIIVLPPWGTPCGPCRLPGVAGLALHHASILLRPMLCIHAEHHRAEANEPTRLPSIILITRWQASGGGPVLVGRTR